MIDLQTLQKVPILARLPEPEQKALAAVLTSSTVRSGKYIVREGDTGRNLYFLLDGKVKVNHLEKDGKEVIFCLLESGEYLGELALLTGKPRSTNVVALTKCTLLTIEAKDFEEHVRRFAGLTFVMLQALATRFLSTSKGVAELVLYDVQDRLLHRLVSMAVPTEIDGDNLLLVRERPSHQQLASMLGCSREAITRALRELEERKDIVVDGDQVIIRLDAFSRR